MHRIRRLIGRSRPAQGAPLRTVLVASLVASGLLVADVSLGGPDHRVTDESKYEDKLSGDQKAVAYGIWTPIHDKIDAAVTAERWQDAQKFANRYLLKAERNQDDWNYGNAIHEAHTALGLAALAEGSVDTAIYHLERAGETPGSPQLDTFGPDSRLASALVAQGAHDAAADWVLAVGEYWHTEDACKQEYVQLRAEHVRNGGSMNEMAFHFHSILELRPQCVLSLADT